MGLGVGFCFFFPDGFMAGLALRLACFLYLHCSRHSRSWKFSIDSDSDDVVLRERCFMAV